MTENKTPQRRFYMTVFLVTCSTATFAYYCADYMTVAVNETINTSHTTAQTTIKGAITQMDGAVSTALQSELQRLLSALNVMTKQKAASGSQLAESSKRTAQTTAAAYGAIKQSERIKQVTLDYSALGQGYNPCLISSERQTTATQLKEVNSEIPALVASEVESAPGRYTDSIATQKKLLADHHQFYCTADQVKAGLCQSVGEMPGASLQASTLFSYAPEGTDLYNAKNALINNMVGLPDDLVPKSVANSPNGAYYTQLKQRKDAMMSPALASLKAIQTDYSFPTTTHGDSATAKPLILQFRDQVGRYLGNGAENKNWNRTLVTSQPRGVLKEVLNVKALELAILARQYHQNQRIEANLASLVAMEQELQSTDTNSAMRLAQQAGGSKTAVNIR